jgi:gliding motility-associated-like protein
MKWLIFISLLGISFISKGQQEIELCPNVRNSFNYWSNASVSGGGWLWTLNSDTISTNQNVRITWTDTGFYILRVYYANECNTPSKIYRVRVKKCPESAIFFPNAFTPDGDGLNDSWSPIPFKITEIRWMIYNRWGEKVYETAKLGDKWDGKHKGALQGTFTFVYICWWKGIDGKTGFNKGTIISIR